MFYSKDLNQLKNELRIILSGKGEESPRNLIQSTLNNIRGFQNTSAESSRTDIRGEYEAKEEIRKAENKNLISFADKNNLFITLKQERYVTKGAENEVYLSEDGLFVFKVNNLSFYQTWFDYLKNLLIHNCLFSDTAYELIGFSQNSNHIYPVVKQPLIIANQDTEKSNIRQFLEANSFKNTRRNDYESIFLGLILEDLHHGNVLTKDDLLYFIDTVFYVKTNI